MQCETLAGGSSKNILQCSPLPSLLRSPAGERVLSSTLPLFPTASGQYGLASILRLPDEDGDVIVYLLDSSVSSLPSK